MGFIKSAFFFVLFLGIALFNAVHLYTNKTESIQLTSWGRPNAATLSMYSLIVSGIFVIVTVFMMVYSYRKWKLKKARQPDPPGELTKFDAKRWENEKLQTQVTSLAKQNTTLQKRLDDMRTQLSKKDEALKQASDSIQKISNRQKQLKEKLAA